MPKFFIGPLCFISISSRTLEPCDLLTIPNPPPETVFLCFFQHCPSQHIPILTPGRSGHHSVMLWRTRVQIGFWFLSLQFPLFNFRCSFSFSQVHSHLLAWFLFLLQTFVRFLKSYHPTVISFFLHCVCEAKSGSCNVF